MSDTPESIDQIVALPIRGRVAFALAVAECIVATLSPAPEGLAIAREALRLSWEWAAGQRVKGDDIAQYVDGPTDKDLGIRELNYSDRTLIAALIAVTLAVGYAARRAYELEGAKSMPEPIWEIDDHSLNDLLENAKLTPLYSENVIRKLVGSLVARYGAQGRIALGDPITEAEVFL